MNDSGFRFMFWVTWVVAILINLVLLAAIVLAAIWLYGRLA